jgi:hypothetical protein
MDSETWLVEHEGSTYVAKAVKRRRPPKWLLGPGSPRRSLGRDL